MATNLDSTTATGQQSSSSLLARPHIYNPKEGSRVGWLIRQKIQRAQMRIQKPVPLLDVSQMDSPVLIFTYERAEYLERTLWAVFEHHPAQQQQQQTTNGNIRSDGETIKRGRIVGAPIIISQDGNNADVAAVVETYRQLFEMKLGIPLYRIEHPRPRTPSNNEYNFYDTDWELPYKMLAQHYGWGLEQTFSGDVYATNTNKHSRSISQPPMPKRVIILEEDIEISRDFFSLMNATADMLDSDSTLFAVSAYNDNGNEGLVSDPNRLVRSDFFPGLGWMMPRSVWDGTAQQPEARLKGSWPEGYWDDWIREPNVRRGRQVIRPEVSRTFHFGNVKGASQGEFIKKLSKIQLDEVNVRWEDQDLSHLDTTAFAKDYWDRVSRAKIVASDVEAKKEVAYCDVRIEWNEWKQFKLLATKFDIMKDEKAGVPRTAYEGIVEIRYGGGDFFIYLTPPYLSDVAMPTDFGSKAFMGFTKETLLQRLGISDKPADDYFRSY